MRFQYKGENGQCLRGTFQIAFFLLVMLAFVPVSQAQQVGTYVLASTQNKEVLKAVKFAVTTEQQKSGKRLTFKSILQAQTQVVAGLNYKVCLKVKEQGKVKTAEAVIYKNLQNAYELTSWEWKECK